MTISVVVVIVFLLGLWRYNNSLPEGLFAGTLWISASALVFLFIISWHRGSFVPQPVIHHAFTIVLALIAFVVGGLIWWPSLHVGDFLGSLNVCLFAFGAVLAIMNGLGLFASLFIDRSIRAERVKFAVLSFTFLLLLAAFTSLLRDFHRVRSCDREGCPKAKEVTAWSPIKSIEERPTVRKRRSPGTSRPNGSITRTALIRTSRCRCLSSRRRAAA